MDLSLDFLFCSVDLYICLCASTILYHSTERGVTVLLSVHLGLVGCSSALLIEAGNPTSRDEFTSEVIISQER